MLRCFLYKEFGLVDWDQFLFSVMGDKAKSLLPLCQIERLESLLNSYSFVTSFFLSFTYQQNPVKIGYPPKREP